MANALIAIVGRPNVGKSSLFNRLTRRRLAVVEETPGVTRDRVYADTDIYDRQCSVVDTGGLDPTDERPLNDRVADQARAAIEEADVIVFVVDVRDGPVPADYEVAEQLRRTQKPVILVANKADDAHLESDDFYSLRFGQPLFISAFHGRNIESLIDQLARQLPAPQPEEDPGDEMTRIAIVGRPNVGKSSLLNAALGEERAIVSDIPGTTRDAIDTALRWQDRELRLIDTAGMRRKARVKQSLEYYCVLRALRAIERADTTIVMLDGEEGPTMQDARIAGYAHEKGKAMVLAVNKWDVVRDRLLDEERDRAEEESLSPAQLQSRTSRREKLLREDFKRLVEQTLPFCSYAPVHFMSALRGEGVDLLLDDAILCAESNHMRVPTSKLNAVLAKAFDRNPPPGRKGRRLKFYYGAQPATAPPVFVLFANNHELVHFSYLRYIENQLREAFGLVGTPIVIKVRSRREKDAAAQP